MQADAAKALVAEMRESGLEPDIYTYGPLVAALGRAGLVDEAFTVCLPLQACRGRRTPHAVCYKDGRGGAGTTERDHRA